jgi:hypothetical protein
MSQKKIPAFPPDLCVTDRREDDRRKEQIPVAVEKRSGTVRRKPRGQRRHQS